MNSLPIITLAIFIMMGCATESWNHPNGMGDFERDRQWCVQLAGQQAMDMDPHTGTTVEQAVDDCLQKKGYVQSRAGRRADADSTVIEEKRHLADRPGAIAQEAEQKLLNDERQIPHGMVPVIRQRSASEGLT